MARCEVWPKRRSSRQSAVSNTHIVPCVSAPPADPSCSSSSVRGSATCVRHVTAITSSSRALGSRPKSSAEGGSPAVSSAARCGAEPLDICCESCSMCSLRCSEDWATLSASRVARRRNTMVTRTGCFCRASRARESSTSMTVTSFPPSGTLTLTNGDVPRRKESSPSTSPAPRRPSSCSSRPSSPRRIMASSPCMTMYMWDRGMPCWISSCPGVSPFILPSFRKTALAFSASLERSLPTALH